jgi:hypothetical protein
LEFKKIDFLSGIIYFLIREEFINKLSKIPILLRLLNIVELTNKQTNYFGGSHCLEAMEVLLLFYRPVRYTVILYFGFDTRRGPWKFSQRLAWIWLRGRSWDHNPDHFLVKKAFKLTNSVMNATMQCNGRLLLDGRLLLAFGLKADPFSTKFWHN